MSSAPVGGGNNFFDMSQIMNALQQISTTVEKLDEKMDSKLNELTQRTERVEQTTSALAALLFQRSNTIFQRETIIIDDRNYSRNTSCDSDTSYVRDTSCVKAIIEEIKQGRGSAAMFLLTNPNLTERDVIEVLETAYRHKYTDIVLYFLNKGHFPKTDDELELIITLIDIHTWRFDGLSLLHIASRDGRYSQVITLLEKGVTPTEVSEKGMQGIHYAAEMGRTEIVELFVLSWNVSIDAASTEEKWTPLHFASRGGILVTMEWLLEHEASVDSIETTGHMPLYLFQERYGSFEKAIKRAIEYGAVLTAKIFLANPHLEKTVFEKALSWACEERSKEIVLHLLNKGYYPDRGDVIHIINMFDDIHTRRFEGLTLLHIASRDGGYYNVDHLLSSKGAIPEVVGYGWTRFAEN